MATNGSQDDWTIVGLSDGLEVLEMYGEVHANRVFYKEIAEPEHRFRQITVHELEHFILTLKDGGVFQDIPFKADNAHGNPSPSIKTCLRF